MTPLVLYLIKVSLLNALMIGFYHFAIKPGRNFGLMRGVLLAAIALPLILPLLSGLFWGGAGDASPIYVITLPETAAVTITAAPKAFSLPALHVLLYTTVTFILVLGAVFSIFSVLQRLKGTKIRITPYGKIYLDDKAVSPFSFFHWVFFPSESLEQPSYDLLLRHEFSHVAHRHSIDRLLSSLFRAFFWFNPFAHLNHRLLSEVHEYQADADAVGALPDITSYQNLMTSFAGLPEHSSITNPFSSHLKKRIIMLNNFKNQKIKVGRILSGLAVVAGIALFTSMVKPGETQVNYGISQSQTALDLSSESVDQTPLKDGEVIPVYPGGEDARIRYFQENVRYPSEARQKNIQGSVDYTIEIDEKGKVTNPVIQKGLGYGCDEEVLSVLKKMPDWKPGTRDGKPAKFVLPFSVKFTLSNGDPDKETLSQGVENEIFTVVENPPSFKGGEDARIEYLMNNIAYPKKAREGKIEGTVYVTFVVEKDGRTSNVKILRGIGGGCDEMAVKVISEMPPWNPGMQRGEPVRVQFTMPIKFTLDPNSPDKPFEQPEKIMYGGREVYNKVDEAPVFPGGNVALLAHLRKYVSNIEFSSPEDSKTSLYMSFIVEPDGSITPGGVSENADAAIKITPKLQESLKSMPVWKPGQKKGVAVPVKVNLFLKTIN